jgi:hypothetical protein
MDLSQVFWKAIHSDHTVDSQTTEKAYTKVKRATLQKLVFYDEKEERVEFTRPENVPTYDIKWRLRTRINQNGSAVEERHWVIQDDKFHLLNENLELHTHDSCEACDKKPITETPVDLL